MTLRWSALRLLADFCRPRLSPSFMSNELCRLEVEELGCRLPEYRDAIGIAQPGRGEDVVDRCRGPRKRIVRPHHDLARADLGDQVTQPFGCKDHRVVIELPQVFGRLLLERLGAPRGEGQATLIGAGGIGREISAGMSSADLQSGVAIERSLENQVRQCDGRFERIADHVVQHTVPFEPAGRSARWCPAGG